MQRLIPFGSITKVMISHGIMSSAAALLTLVGTFASFFMNNRKFKTCKSKPAPTFQILVSLYEEVGQSDWDLNAWTAAAVYNRWLWTSQSECSLQQKHQSTHLSCQDILTTSPQPMGSWNKSDLLHWQNTRAFGEHVEIFNGPGFELLPAASPQLEPASTRALYHPSCL